MTRSRPPNRRSMGASASTRASYGLGGSRPRTTALHDERQGCEEREPGRDRDHDRDPAEPAAAVTRAGDRRLRGQVEHRPHRGCGQEQAAVRALAPVPERLTGLRVAQRVGLRVRVEVLPDRGGGAVRAGHDVCDGVLRAEGALRPLLKHRIRLLVEHRREEPGRFGEPAELRAARRIAAAVALEDEPALLQAGPLDRRLRRALRHRARGDDEGGEDDRTTDEEVVSHAASTRAAARRFRYTAAAERTSAASRSATRSSGDSRPTERRTRLGEAANGPSAVEACVIRAGGSMRVSTPPSDSASFQIFVRATSPTASSSDSARKETMPPKSAIWRAAISCPGWPGRPG